MAERANAWEVARHLVIDEGQSYAEVAGLTGIPLSTLQKRAADERWQDQRKTAVDYGVLCRQLRAKLAENALAAVTKGESPAAHIDALFKADRLAARGSTVDPKVRLSAGAELLELVVQVLAAEAPAALNLIEPHLETIARRWEATCQG